MPTRPWSGPTAVVVLAFVIAIAGIGAHPALAGSSPVDPASTGGEGPATLTLTGTYTPFELEGREHEHDREGGSAGLVEGRDGSAVLVRFASPTAIEAGATITVSIDPDGGSGSIVRDVERLVAVRPPAVATSPRRASPDEPGVAKAAPGGAEAGGPLAANAPKTMLIIPVWCSHQNGTTTVAPMPTSPTPTDYEQLVTSTVSPWFDQFSWRTRTFVPTATPWYDICPAWGPLPLSPEAVAAQHGYVSSSYDRVVMVLASATSWLGAAEGVPGRRAILFNATLDPGVWIHELGHLEGLVHANSLRCLQGVVPVMYSVNASCTSNEYGDPSDTMGDLAAEAGFSAVEADQVGWLPPQVLTTVTSTAKVRIANYALPHSAFTTRAVKIPLPSGTYYVERRAAVGWDAGLGSLPGLTTGVQVRVEAGAVDSSQFTATWQRHGNLLDATPSTPTFDDASLPMGQVFLTPEGVRIWALPSSGGLTTIYVDMPLGMTAPSNPQRVKANVLANGTVSVGWDPPARNPGNLTYEIRTSDVTQAPITTTSLSAVLPPLPDGTSAVGVRAYVTGSPGVTSQFAASLPRFTFPLPATPNIAVQEGSPSGNVSHTVTLTLPWLPYGGAVRNLGLYPGTADPTDWVPVGATATFTGLTATYTFEVVADSLPEADETMDIVVADQRCAGGWIVPDCIVPTPIATITILNDD